VAAMSAQGQTRRKAGTQSLRSRATRDSGVTDAPWTTKAVVKRSWLYGLLRAAADRSCASSPRPEHSGRRMARTHFCKHQRPSRILSALALGAAWCTVGMAHGSRLHHHVSTSPPTISGVPPTTDLAGSPYSFQPSASGASGAMLAFSVQNKPAWASLSIASGLLSGTPNSMQTGVYPNIILSVSDGTNSRSLPAFSITVSSAGGSSSSSQATILFEQPQLSSIADNFVVPPATHTPPPKGKFTLVLWQADRFTSNGLLVPTGWDAGTQTGFTPSAAMTGQLGFQNKPGTSTAQMEADAVGAYINSQDLPQSSADQKMMITPQFTFPLGAQPMPFASPDSSLHGSLDLQVPAATGSDVYVVADLLFEGPNGARISFGIAIFRNGGVSSVVTSGYDSPSNSYILNSPLGVDQRFVTQASNSAAATGTPWSGWRHFEWRVSENQFVDALQYLTGAFPGKLTSTDPVHYVLTKVHLNAEFHTKGQQAELGWSMRGLKLWTTP